MSRGKCRTGVFRRTTGIEDNRRERPEERRKVARKVNAEAALFPSTHLRHASRSRRSTHGHENIKSSHQYLTSRNGVMNDSRDAAGDDGDAGQPDITRYTRIVSVSPFTPVFPSVFSSPGSAAREGRAYFPCSLVGIDFPMHARAPH